jgi:hypothetical protein
VEEFGGLCLFLTVPVYAVHKGTNNLKGNNYRKTVKNTTVLIIFKHIFHMGYSCNNADD